MQAGDRRNLQRAVEWSSLARKSIEQGDAEGAMYSSLQALSFAWLVETSIGAKPLIERDSSRQKGTRVKRKTRWLHLDGFLDNALEKKPDAMNKQIWKLIPKLLIDDNGVYRDGEQIVQIIDGVQKPRRPLEFGGFEKRVRARRKLRNSRK